MSQRVSFFARQAHYIDHMAPVWNALSADRRGSFYIGSEVCDYAKQKIDPRGLVVNEGLFFPGTEPILTCAYGDMSRAKQNGDHPVITMEHGVGHSFKGPAYPGGVGGKRDLVSLELMPNEYTAKIADLARPGIPRIVIGTPKMDEWTPTHKIHVPADPVLAIAFHWGDDSADPPESGTAWKYYEPILSELASRYHLIGHGHPIAAEMYKTEFERRGIEWVPDFRDVMKRADVYLNDLSSTMYEFLVTGKPVIVLNAPWFRRGINWGLRFWDYSNVGINVWDRSDLFDIIDQTLQEYDSIHINERFTALFHLYPYLGHSARVAAQVLRDWMDGKL